MKKLFTLAIAAAAVMTAGAATSRNLTVHSHCSIDETQTRHQRVAATPASRTTDITGRYCDGIMQGFFQNGAVVGQLGKLGSGFEIVADPETENGYVIKNLFEGILFDEQNPGKSNDLKATFDPVSGVLSIPGRQTLFSEEIEGYGMVDFQMITCPSMENTQMDADLPIEFSYDCGVFSLVSPSIEFGQPYGDEGGMVVLEFGVANFSAWIPNGEMTYFSVVENRRVTAPILGVNINGENLIYNFGNADPLNPTSFLRKGDKVEYRYELNPTNGEKYYAAAFIAFYYPSLMPEANVLDYFYLTAVEPDGDGFIPMENSKYDFFVEGTVVKNTSDECVIELPDCGLYDEKDVVWDIYTDVEISYNPNAIAGIESVGAGVDNTNAPVVYYNLQGVRVDNPQGGIFIRRQGTEATKVFVK